MRECCIFVPDMELEGGSMNWRRMEVEDRKGKGSKQANMPRKKRRRRRRRGSRRKLANEA